MEDNSVEDTYIETTTEKVIDYLERRVVEDEIGAEVRDAVSTGYDAY